MRDDPQPRWNLAAEGVTGDALDCLMRVCCRPMLGASGGAVMRVLVLRRAETAMWMLWDVSGLPSGTVTFLFTRKTVCISASAGGLR